jgi:acylphosphatase
MNSEREAIRIVIHGRVQGVWYRGWTVDQARARGLAGWVRNRRDGTVEAVLIGSVAAVREMIEACRSGPPAARVRGIEEHPAGEDALSGDAWHVFDQRPTV